MFPWCDPPALPQYVRLTAGGLPRGPSYLLLPPRVKLRDCQDDQRKGASPESELRLGRGGDRISTGFLDRSGVHIDRELSVWETARALEPETD